MFKQEPHPTEQELLLFLDGELPGRRASRIRAHLTACWDCRARMTEIECTIADFVRVHGESVDALTPPSAGSRALLKCRLAELRAKPHPHSWRWFFHLDRVARIGLYAAAITLMTIEGGKAIHRYLTLQALNSAVAVSRAEPDQILTPGATRNVALKEVCSMAHEEVIKPVSEPLRKRVFQEYGIINADPDDYEIDYLIAPGLGGVEDIQNLWPEPNASPAWNSHAKDALEERLHQLVCSGKVDLATAQHDIAKDWIAAYKKYVLVGTDLPSHSTRENSNVSSYVLTLTDSALFDGLMDRSQIYFPLKGNISALRRRV